MMKSSHWLNVTYFISYNWKIFLSSFLNKLKHLEIIMYYFFFEFIKILINFSILFHIRLRIYFSRSFDIKW
jgi:hypothetical protein